MKRKFWTTILLVTTLVACQTSTSFGDDQIAINTVEIENTRFQQERLDSARTQALSPEKIVQQAQAANGLIPEEDLQQISDKYSSLPDLGDSSARPGQTLWKLDHPVFISIPVTDTDLVALTIAAAVGIFAYKKADLPIDNYVKRAYEPNGGLQKVANVGNQIANAGWVYMLGDYLVGVYKEKVQGDTQGGEEIKKVGILLFSFYTVDVLTFEPLNRLTGMARPAANMGHSFGHDGNNNLYQAFDSGHTASSVGFATILSDVYGKEHPWIPYVAYSAAALTALSRVYDRKHFLSGVLLGAAEGYFQAEWLYRAMYKKEIYPGLYISPDPTNCTLGKAFCPGFSVRYLPKAPEDGPCKADETGHIDVHACMERRLGSLN